MSVSSISENKFLIEPTSGLVYCLIRISPGSASYTGGYSNLTTSWVKPVLH